jgi:hypothetical protein
MLVCNEEPSQEGSFVFACGERRNFAGQKNFPIL